MIFNHNNLQYESVFVLDKTLPAEGKKKPKKTKQVVARLFDPITQKSTFKDVTQHSIPDIFIADNKTPNSIYKSYLDDKIPLTRRKFNTLQEYNKFIRSIKVKTGEIKTIEYDGEMIDIEETIFEDDAYGYQNLGHTFLHRAFPNSEDSIHTHRIWFLDIETRSDHAVNHFPHAFMAPEEITMIQIYDNFSKQYIVLGRKDFTGEFDNRLNVKYIKIEEEAKLLQFFIKILNKHNPSIISGWNSKTFDMPYLTNRIAIVLDGFKGDFKEKLNKKDSYISMENVKKLSPLGVVNGRDTHTMDGMDGVEVFWRGILLLDYRELTLKYGFLGLASYSLKNVANHFNLSQKIDNSAYTRFDGSYTGDGYIFPLDDPNPGEDIIFDAQLKYKNEQSLKNKKELEQTVFNRFVDYSLRDVEILVELNDIAKYLDSHMQIAYFCRVSADDCWGTQKHWVSLMYKEAYDNNLILPLKQQHSEEDVQFFAGWVRTVPGKYDYITSFDFTSLYPSLIRAFNIGGDSLLKAHEIPKELKDLKEKYFNHFVKEKLNREEYPDLKEANGVVEKGRFLPLGTITQKYKGEINDIVEEREYYSRLMDNSEEISTVLKKYNVCVTANGYFYKRDRQSIFASQMERFFKERVKEKREGQRMEGVVQELIKNSGTDSEIFDAKRKQEFHENRSIVLKVLLNSSYGVSALGSNPFANGKLTGASITTSGRMCNQIVMMNLNEYLASLCGLDLVKEELDFIMQADTDSGYVSLERMMKLDKFKSLSEDQKITIAKKISEGKLQDIINETLHKVGITFNLFEPKALVMENEVITRGFVSLANKRYFTRVIVNDGNILAKPKMKVVGVSLVSYSTPPFLKEKLRPVLDIVLDGNDRDLQTYIRGVRDEFGKIDPMEFVRTAKVNNLRYIKKDGKYKRQKENGSWLTAPLGSTAALEHNRVSKLLKVTGRFPLIEKGDSLSYVYVRQPNYLKIAGAIGFTDPKFSREVNLKDIADYEMHWQKDFIHKIEIITKPLNWNVRRNTQAITPW